MQHSVTSENNLDGKLSYSEIWFSFCSRNYESDDDVDDYGDFDDEGIIV